MVTKGNILNIFNKIFMEKGYTLTNIQTEDKCLKYETTYIYTNTKGEEIVLELHEFKKNNKRSQEAFYNKLLKAYDYQMVDGWRVEVYDENGEKLPLSHWDDTRMFVTKSGSTIAIRDDGDIISVCKNLSKTPSDNMKALIEFATENGGDRLDSFDGNYGFYRACGFVPVSWIHFNYDFSPKGENGWIDGIHDPEPIIFMKYVNKANKKLSVDEAIKEIEDFYINTPPNTGNNAYDDAKDTRDNNI